MGAALENHSPKTGTAVAEVGERSLTVPSDAVRGSGTSARLEVLARLASDLTRRDDPGFQDIGQRIGEWFRRGAEEPLDAALGLRARGGVSPRRALQIGERDDMLRGLYRASSDWRDLPPAAAARLMALSAERYATSRWPREQGDLSAPSGQPSATWWRVLRGCGRVPGSRQIQRILESDIQTPL